MNFNKHSHLEGKHALLSPSQYSWINYDDHKMFARYVSYRAAARGTSLHNLAHSAIQLGVQLSDSEPTLAMYVADGIGYKMEVEQPLFYSNNCFGTADTITFRQMFLRIHDLKTGLAPTSFHQLEVYAALFCLEYGVDPWEIEIELRIYQPPKADESPCRIFAPEKDQILHIMDRIVYLDKLLNHLREEEG